MDTPELVVTIPSSEIREGIVDAIRTHRYWFHQPAADAIRAHEERFAAIINAELSAICEDPSFRKRLRQTLQEALISEATSKARAALKGISRSAIAAVLQSVLASKDAEVDAKGA